MPVNQSSQISQRKDQDNNNTTMSATATLEQAMKQDDQEQFEDAAIKEFNDHTYRGH